MVAPADIEVEPFDDAIVVDSNNSARLPAVRSEMTVTFDAESFAAAVAAAVAAVLAERPEVFAPRPSAPPQWSHVMPPAADPPKRSFWSGLWHADVLLAVMAMAIILVILLAWSV